MTSIKQDEQNNNNNNINKKKMNQTSSTSAETAATPLLLSFGLIADVQYCTHDDVWNFAHTTLRSFKNSLNILKASVKYFNEKNLAFIADLGDIIDGRCKTIGTSDMDLKIVLDEFEKMNCNQINHLIGNHELYNYKRKDLKKLLNTTNGVNGQTTWYSYRPVEKVPFRVIVLDTYDISYIEGTTNERTEEAKAILAKYNPNDFSKKGVNWVSGLKGKNRRYLPYNGGISKAQLDFLNETCKKADEMNEQCVVMGHVQVCPGACSNTCILYNYEDVLNIFHKYDCVVAYCAGHDHSGGYIEKNGIHYLTLPSPLETKIGDMCFGSIDIYDDKMKINSIGNKMQNVFPDKLLPLRKNVIYKKKRKKTNKM